MHVIIVEDDYVQYQELKNEIERSFEDVVVDLIKTEHQFYKEVDRILNDPPDAIIMDVMMKWTDPSEDMPRPPENVKKEGFSRAGIRCQMLISEKNENILVILYTVLDSDDLSDDLRKLFGNFVYVGKTNNTQDLIREIRKRI